jgi:hypothetical protein
LYSKLEEYFGERTVRVFMRLIVACIVISAIGQMVRLMRGL